MKTYFDNLKFIYSSPNIQHDINTDINNLNNELCSNTAGNVFATLFAGYLNKKTLELTYFSAGHIDQYAIVNKDIIPLNSSSTMLGLFAEAEYSPQKIKLNKGDKVILFTDGVVEVWKNEELLGEDRIIEIIKNNVLNSASDIINRIDNELIQYAGGNSDDDVTILGIELL